MVVYLWLIFAVLKSACGNFGRNNPDYDVLSISFFGLILAGMTGSVLDNAKLHFIFLFIATLLLSRDIKRR